jgi:hypothetical protein
MAAWEHRVAVALRWQRKEPALAAFDPCEYSLSRARLNTAGGAIYAKSGSRLLLLIRTRSSVAFWPLANTTTKAAAAAAFL